MADKIDPQKVPIDPDEIVIRHIPKDQLPDITAGSFVLRDLRGGREKGQLAFHLFALPGASPEITVCLDDHHIESRGKLIFAIDEFLASEGWSLMQQKGKRMWLGTYASGDKRLVLSTDSRLGDVIATVGSKIIRAECKKGKLLRAAGNPENRLVHEAIGQLMTVEAIRAEDVLLVAIPRCDHHVSKLAWQARPLMQRIGISIVLVGRDGTVEGMPRL